MSDQPKSQSQSQWGTGSRSNQVRLSAKGIKWRFITERSPGIESAAPQASHEKEVPVHGGEKLQSNVVPAQSVPVPEPKLGAVLPDGGQGGEDVTARRTRSGRVVKKSERLDL